MGQPSLVNAIVQKFLAFYFDVTSLNISLSMFFR
jgi:hypothetical protein